MRLIAIFATTEAGAFGVTTGLPWGRSAPDDLQHFKDITMGSVMIMGYNTLDGVKHLQGRDKIVITSGNWDSTPPATHFVTSIEEAIQKAKDLGHREAYLIGGAQLLRTCAHLADEVLWSRIPGCYIADVFLDVENIVGERALIGSSHLEDGTTVFRFAKLVAADNKSALEEALDREQKMTFGNIPIKENLEYAPSEAKEDALDITKQMIRGRS